MPKDYTTMTVGELEDLRQLVLDRIAAVPRFRRGSLQVGYRKCGKKTCSCAQPGAQGHGPRALWTRTVKGRPRGQVIPMDQVEHVETELEGYAQFAALVEDYVEINEVLCRAEITPSPRGRPKKTSRVPDPATSGEKGG